MNQTKIDNLSKAQARKMATYAKENQKLKIARTSQLLTGYLRTAILADTI